jgi:death-on-curing protein
VSNHGFVDGNKRTALALTDLLIKRSGYRLTGATDEEDLDLALEELAVSVARGKLKFDAISDWFKQRLVAQ